MSWVLAPNQGIGDGVKDYGCGHRRSGRGGGWQALPCASQVPTIPGAGNIPPSKWSDRVLSQHQQDYQHLNGHKIFKNIERMLWI